MPGSIWRGCFPHPGWSYGACLPVVGSPTPAACDTWIAGCTTEGGDDSETVCIPNDSVPSCVPKCSHVQGSCDEGHLCWPRVVEPGGVCVPDVWPDDA